LNYLVRPYRTTLTEIRQAHRVGAISAEEMTAAISRERQATLASIAAVKGRTTALGGMSTATRNASHRMANLSFQLQDIGVSLAGGMNPFMVMAQQGSQISQIYGLEKLLRPKQSGCTGCSG
jgi:phage-related minor tail protein